MTNREQNTKHPQSDGTTCPVMTDRERRFRDCAAYDSMVRAELSRADYPRLAPTHIVAFLAGAESEAAHWEARVKPIIEQIEDWARHTESRGTMGVLAERAEEILAAFRATDGGRE